MTTKYLKFILILLPILLLIMVIVIYGKSVISTLQTNKPKFPKTIQQDLDYLKTNTEKCKINEEYSASCLENFFNKYLKFSSAKEILHRINLLSQNNRDLGAECHVIAHALGRQVLVAQGTVDKAFTECSEECSSGCYHGIVEKFFLGADPDKNSNIHSLDISDLKKKIKEVCSNTSSDVSATGCWHGAGHGLMLFLGYNLSQALAMCDVFNDVDEQRECYTGVFMENVVAAQKEKRILKKTDLQFPCNTVAEKYKEDCFQNQIIWWEEVGLSTKKSINECKKTGKYTSACIESLGGNLSDYLNGDFNEIARVCGSLEINLKQRCIKGVVGSLFESGAADIPKFCYALKAKQDQNYCSNVQSE